MAYPNEASDRNEASDQNEASNRNEASDLSVTAEPMITTLDKPTRKSRGSRWLVPVAAALAVLTGGAAIGVITAAADPSVPTRSAAELLTDLQTARLDGLSGTVVQKSDLGLPALPGAGQGSAELTSLISGTHTLRVWYSGPDKARIALLGTLGETDVITNGKDLWIWSSKENTATHRTLPARSGPAGPTPSMGAFTPQDLAGLALKVLSPTTQVSTDGRGSVAGRDADELVLAPRDPASLIGSIRLAIDAAEHVPLRVQVFARGADSPAIEVAFTEISFARPGDDQFTFNPPPGATVVEGDAAKDAKPAKGAKPFGGFSADGERPKLATVGSGWTTVLVAPMPQSSATPQGSADKLKGLLNLLPAVSGSWGSGHLLSSSLVNVLITDDGRVLIGAVRPDRLYQAAADPAAAIPR